MPLNVHAAQTCWQRYLLPATCPAASLPQHAAASGVLPAPHSQACSRLAALQFLPLAVCWWRQGWRARQECRLGWEWRELGA